MKKLLGKVSADLRMLLIYLLVWLIPLVIFWTCIYGIGAMLYSIVFLFGWYPLSALIISYKIGQKGYWGVWKWFAPLLIGVMNGLGWNLTFDLLNAISLSGNLDMPHMQDILLNLVASAIGLVSGVVVRIIGGKVNEKNTI